MPSAQEPTLVGHTIEHGRLKLIDVIGKGAFGIVYLAYDTRPSTSQDGPRYFAVKSMSKARLAINPRSIEDYMRETSLHRYASQHPNIVSLHRVFDEVVDGQELSFMIMDYYPGDLFAQITRKHRYARDDELVRKVFLQIIDAVAYCHSVGISHRDLKPENVLCTNDGLEIALADFGFATMDQTSSDPGVGSAYYMAPECHGTAPYRTDRSDVWALGVILVNLAYGRNPWTEALPSDDTYRTFAKNPNFLSTILPVSRPVNDILKNVFSANPRDRMSVRQLRRAITGVRRFSMTTEEVSRASPEVQQVAALMDAARVARDVEDERRRIDWEEMAQQARFMDDPNVGGGLGLEGVFSPRPSSPPPPSLPPVAVVTPLTIITAPAKLKIDIKAARRHARFSNAGSPYSSDASLPSPADSYISSYDLPMTPGKVTSDLPHPLSPVVAIVQSTPEPSHHQHHPIWLESGQFESAYQDRDRDQAHAGPSSYEIESAMQLPLSLRKDAAPQQPRAGGEFSRAEQTLSQLSSLAAPKRRSPFGVFHPMLKKHR